MGKIVQNMDVSTPSYAAVAAATAGDSIPAPSSNLQPSTDVKQKRAKAPPQSTPVHFPATDVREHLPKNTQDSVSNKTTLISNSSYLSCHSRTASGLPRGGPVLTPYHWQQSMSRVLWEIIYLCVNYLPSSYITSLSHCIMSRCKKCCIVRSVSIWPVLTVISDMHLYYIYGLNIYQYPWYNDFP